MNCTVYIVHVVYPNVMFVGMQVRAVQHALFDVSLYVQWFYC